jgi:hypothetical protein
MRELMGPTIGSALSGLLIGCCFLAGPAPQPSPAILLSQVIESNPKPPMDQSPVKPLDEMPKPPMEQKPARPLEVMPKSPIEQNPTPPTERTPTPYGEKGNM